MKTHVAQTIVWKLCLFKAFIISLLCCVTRRQYRELLRTPYLEGEYKRFVLRLLVRSLLLSRKVRCLRLLISRHTSRKEFAKILLQILSIDNCDVT